MEYRVEESLRYTKTHEWVRREGAEAVVGISDYAQDKLSDVVFVDLPAVGKELEAGKAFLHAILHGSPPMGRSIEGPPNDRCALRRVPDDDLDLLANARQR